MATGLDQTTTSPRLFLAIQDVMGAWGLSERTARRMIRGECWKFEEVKVRGGTKRLYPVASLPAHRQREYWAKLSVSDSQLPGLVLGHDVKALPGGPGPRSESAGGLELAASPGPSQGLARFNGGTYLDGKALRRIQISQEAGAVPDGWKKREWVEAVAHKHDVSAGTVYRLIASPLKKHREGRRFKKWDAEAVSFWLGLVAKPQHRRLSRRVLYSHLEAAAKENGWRIGGYRSALGIIERDLDPLMRAYQKGGARALDNALPPVLRDYSDLDPLEIVCGDQHICDFWVTDETTGQVFRPVLYLLQDLRTRALVGVWAGQKYSAQTIGQAMRVCLRMFGSFKSFYSDWGKPEISRYVEGIMKDLARMDPAGDADPDANNLRRAIVRNAKAKLIENTNKNLEAILRDEMLVPGYCKRLGDSPEEQEADQREADRLAQRGELLTFGEFMRRVLGAMTHYNSRKHHSGLVREWKWPPRPQVATPMACWQMCVADGWKPTRIPEAAVDVLLMPKAVRVVDRGRINFDHRKFEHTALARMHGQRVEVRYDFFDRDSILVFSGGDFIGEAHEVSYSSMKDRELASEKIRQKRALAKQIKTEFKALVAGVPDVREFSAVPAAERTAALIGREKRRRFDEEVAPFLPKSESEHEAGVSVIDEYEPTAIEIFDTGADRYSFLLQKISRGAAINEDEKRFMEVFESELSPGGADYWLNVVSARGLAGDFVPRLEGLSLRQGGQR